MEQEFEIGDLVTINKDLSEWEHLNEKSDNHPLKKHGVVIEMTDVRYVIRFGNFTAFLKAKDLLKLEGKAE